MSRHAILLTLALGAMASAASAAQPAAGLPGYTPRDRIRVTHVQGNVHQLSGAGGNITVQVGDEGVVVINTGDGRQNDAVLAAIRELAGTKPLLYIANTQGTRWNIGGNPALRSAGTTFTGGNANVRGVSDVGAGAAVLAHENMLLAISSDGPHAYGEEFWPGQTFHIDTLDLFVNGEPIELVHVPNAITDGDLIVHFRRSDVVSTGDVFSYTSYPMIDPSRGGTLAGTIRALEKVMEIAVTANLEEGGTMIVAGNGRIGDQSEVVQYRNMLVFIRDQIADMIKDGKSLPEILRAKPIMDFDVIYSRPGWTGDQFVELVYRELAQ
jgi:glyoxylase-like metal-dependent hydrolase (beta-lactamase superfamily II)